MNGETTARAKVMLSMVVEQGRSFAEAGARFGLTRSTAERAVKRLVADAYELPADRPDEAPAAFLKRIAPIRTEVLSACLAHTPYTKQAARSVLTSLDIDGGVELLRSRSQNANRDVALLLVLLGTGAKPIEIARLQVRDYLDSTGAVRSIAEMPAAATANGQSRAIHFTSSRVRSAVDDYLVERQRRGLGVGESSTYRGLDPLSGLFLTDKGQAFEVHPRGANDPRLVCRLILSTYQTIFKRAGWPGYTAQAARRQVARGLCERGADVAEVGQLLGIALRSSVRRLLKAPAVTVDAISRDLV